MIREARCNRQQDDVSKGLASLAFTCGRHILFHFKKGSLSCAYPTHTKCAARHRQTGGGACVRVQAPTSVGGWDYLRICCPQVKFVMCSNSWLFRTWIPSTPSWITHFLSLFWPCPTLPNWSTPITESGLYIENLGDRSSYISNTCMFCTGMQSRYWLQVLLRV